MAKKPSTGLPRTQADVAREKQEELNTLHTQIEALRQSVKNIIHENFIANGGCTDCNGRGWRVMWDTLDCMDGSCAEYGPCKNPNCTKESREKSGLDAGDSYQRKYDRWKNVVDPLENHPAWKLMAPHLQILDRILHNEIELLRQRPGKGSKVVVVKGRKAPIGFVGELFWLHDEEWGTRVGIKNEAGEVAWTYLKNVEKVAE